MVGRTPSRREFPAWLNLAKPLLRQLAAHELAQPVMLLRGATLPTGQVMFRIIEDTAARLGFFLGALGDKPERLTV